MVEIKYKSLVKNLKKILFKDLESFIESLGTVISNI